MAQRVQTILIDDISGEEITDGETLTFQWRGVPYVIDLGEAHVAKFEKAMAPYLKVARRDGRPKAREAGPPRRPRTDKELLANIREWAREQGIAVSERGRISFEVRNAYEQAHSPEAMAG